MREILINGKVVFAKKVASLDYMKRLAMNYKQPAEIRLNGKTVWAN